MVRSTVENMLGVKKNLEKMKFCRIKKLKNDLFYEGVQFCQRAGDLIVKPTSINTADSNFRICI